MRNVEGKTRRFSFGIPHSASCVKILSSAKRAATRRYVECFRPDSSLGFHFFQPASREAELVFDRKHPQMWLAARTVDADSNEITAVPKLLELLVVEGALVTLDAMHCPKEMAQKIREGGGDYLPTVK
jgi:hypothetical protein